MVADRFPEYARTRFVSGVVPGSTVHVPALKVMKIGSRFMDDPEPMFVEGVFVILFLISNGTHVYMYVVPIDFNLL